MSGQKKKGKSKKNKKKQSRGPVILIGLAAVLLLAVVALAAVRAHEEKLSDVPTEIAEFVELNKQASSFAENYDKYHDSTEAIDVSKEIEEGEIPLFLQWDKRWAYYDYGGSYLGINGCATTCLSMVACGLTGNPEYTPLAVAKYSDECGYYVPGQGTSWTMMTEGASAFGLTGETGEVTVDFIEDNLSAQTPMIASMAPGDFTTEGHMIVLAGLTEDGQVIVNDPNSPSNSKKTWSAETLVSQTKQIWIYTASGE